MSPFRTVGAPWIEPGDSYRQRSSPVAESNAYTLPSYEPTYTVLFQTAGAV
jgi:hypothetical protein